jgi:hypothetical protein
MTALPWPATAGRGPSFLNIFTPFNRPAIPQKTQPLTRLPARNRPTDSGEDPVLLGVLKSIAGAWQGTLKVGDVRLSLVINLTEKAPGAWIGTLDAPDSGRKGIPIDDIVIGRLKGYQSWALQKIPAGRFRGFEVKVVSFGPIS